MVSLHLYTSCSHVYFNAKKTELASKLGYEDINLSISEHLCASSLIPPHPSLDRMGSHFLPYTTPKATAEHYTLWGIRRHTSRWLHDHN